MFLNITFLDTSKDWIIVYAVRKKEGKLVLKPTDKFGFLPLLSLTSPLLSWLMTCLLPSSGSKWSFVIWFWKGNVSNSLQFCWKKTLSKMDTTLNCHRPSLFFLLLPASEVIMTREVEMCPNHSPDSWWQWRKHYRQEIGKNKMKRQAGRIGFLKGGKRNPSLPDKLAWRFWSRKAYEEFLMLPHLLFVSLSFLVSLQFWWSVDSCSSCPLFASLAVVSILKWSEGKVLILFGRFKGFS